MKWHVESTQYLTKHPPFFISRKDVCTRSDGTIVPAYYVVEMPESVLVFALMENKEVLMVRQYRHPVRQISLELPGGFVDEGETSLEAAKREIREETGCVFSNYSYLGKVAANPGVLNNFTHIYFADGIIEQGSQQLDRSEEIKIESYPIDELVKMLKEGRIIQSMHINACFYALIHVGKIKING